MTVTVGDTVDTDRNTENKPKSELCHCRHCHHTCWKVTWFDVVAGMNDYATPSRFRPSGVTADNAQGVCIGVVAASRIASPMPWRHNVPE